jgi:uncharacterized membrane protein
MALLLIIPVFASASVQQFNIEIMTSGAKALVSYEISAEQQGIQLILPEDAKITEISETNYSFEDGKLTSASGSLKLSYLTGTFIEKAGKIYFTADFKLPQTENLNARLILPEFSILENSYPQAEITSDGKHIILEWKAQNKENFPVFVIYREKVFSWNWIIAIIAIAIIISIFLIKRKLKVIKAKVKPKAKPKEELHLLESEAAVIKAIKENKGELWQKQIQIKTGFSKAKLSRTIRNLEARNLVKRIPLGNTNKIKLK